MIESVTGVGKLYLDKRCTSISKRLAVQRTLRVQNPVYMDIIYHSALLSNRAPILRHIRIVGIQKAAALSWRDGRQSIRAAWFMLFPLYGV